MALDPFQRRLIKNAVAAPSRIRTFADSPTPAAYRHRMLVKTLDSDVYSRVLQDGVEASMLRQIRHEAPGPRRDYLIRDLEIWRQNGKPVFWQRPAKKGFRSLSGAEPVAGHRKARPIWKDVAGDQDALRRLLRRGSIR